LLWRGGTLLGNYRSRQIDLNAGGQWLVGTRHELRVKLSSIALDASARQAWRVQPGGRATTSPEPLADFSLQRLGLQVRYRYELRPLSYVYLVYSRGGQELANGSGDSLGDLVSGAFSLRDSEQFLLKFNYRFEL
jgi:hypothetical protein